MRYAAHQVRAASTVPSELERTYSPSNLNNVSNGPDPLAELRLKAKESILAKKAQTIRSSSQDPAGLAMQNNKPAIVKSEATTQDHISDVQNAALSTPSFEEATNAVSKLNSSTTRTVGKSSAGRLWKNPVQFESSGNAGHAMIRNIGGMKASNVELEDLLAEGRAAAEKRPQQKFDVGSTPNAIKHRSQTSPDDGRTCEMRMTTNMTSTSTPEESGFSRATRYHDFAAKGDSQNDMATTSTAETATPRALLVSTQNNGPSSRLHNDGNVSGTPTGKDGVKSRIKRTLASAQEQGSDACGVLRKSESPETAARLPQNSVQMTRADADADMKDANMQNRGPNDAILSSEHSDLPRFGANEVSANQHNLDDVEEWLSMTGFHDEPYRLKVLNRRRRMKAIEEEKMQLLLEEQADHMVRSQSVLPRNIVPASPFLARATSVVAMPPPPTAPVPTPDLGLRIKDAALKNEADLQPTKSPKVANNANSLKRQNSSSDMRHAGEEQARKSMRIDSSDQATYAMNVDEVPASSATVNKRPPTSPRSRPQASNNAQDVYRRSFGQQSRIDAGVDQDNKRRYDQWMPEKPTGYDSYRRTSQEDRLDRPVEPERRMSRTVPNGAQRRSDYQELDYRSRRYGEHEDFRRGSLDDDKKMGINLLRTRGVRYFLIKSWNYENIETAQRECTWCTQTKNEEIFNDAFNHSTHVILIFSANNSHAFQGYARMQCLPGEPGVADPSWRKYLHWPTTKPFRISWLVKGDIPYRVAGKLKNPLNEDTPVFVGRDGQEIPDSVGLELCEAIESDANKFRSHGGHRHLDY